MATQEQNYAGITINDHEYDDGSSTEVCESLISHDDKDWETRERLPRGRRGRARRVCEAFVAWRWVLDTVLLLIILGLLVDRKLQVHDAKQHGNRKHLGSSHSGKGRHGKSSEFEFAGDLTGFAPKCKKQLCQHL